jgi:hypothetical protein
MGGGICEVAFEMGSSVMIYTYIPSYIMTSSAIQKLMGGYTDTDRYRKHGDRISLLSSFQNKESRLNESVVNFNNNSSNLICSWYLGRRNFDLLLSLIGLYLDTNKIHSAIML